MGNRSYTVVDDDTGERRVIKYRPSGGEITLMVIGSLILLFGLVAAILGLVAFVWDVQPHTLIMNEHAVLTCYSGGVSSDVLTCPNRGDTQVWSDELRSKDDSESVGITAGDCTTVDAATNQMCNQDFIFPDGSSISTRGRFINDPEIDPPVSVNVWSIIGGTGKYKTIRGTAKTETTSTGPEDNTAVYKWTLTYFVDTP